MRATETKTIGGHAFTVTQLGATKGVLLLNRLIRIAGPATGKLVEAVDLKGGTRIKLEDVQIDKLFAALSILSERLSDSELQSIMETLLAESTMDGQPLWGAQFDVLLGGQFPTVLKLLAFALSVNYRGFFGSGGLASFAAMAGVAAAKSPSPNT